VSYSASYIHKLAADMVAVLGYKAVVIAHDNVVVMQLSHRNSDTKLLDSRLAYRILDD